MGGPHAECCVWASSSGVMLKTPFIVDDRLTVIASSYGSSVPCHVYTQTVSAVWFGGKACVCLG